ncbi:MAG: response regulator [Euryarchaeota archaeon]|nr:response regulator [Euryarchaeota archaeon]
MAKIMVVDDEPDVVKLVRSALKDEGYEIIEVSSGKECLRLLETETPDLILLDVMMPEMDGWEVCRRIKDNPETSSITVAMLTVKSQDEDKITSLEDAKADWHIKKPIRVDGLRQTVRWLLENPMKRGD